MASKTRVELPTSERFELWGKRVAVMTFQAPKGQVDWDTWVSFRTNRSEFIGSVRVRQSSEAFNAARTRNLMVGF